MVQVRALFCLFCCGFGVPVYQFCVSVFVSVSPSASQEAGEWTDAPLSKITECIRGGEGWGQKIAAERPVSFPCSTVCTTADEGDWRLPGVHRASKRDV